MDHELIKLADNLGQLLREKKAILAVAESCTGGGICHLLTNCAGSSQWFECGFISYSNQSKIKMLGVNPQTLEKFGAVSQETALEMARGALEKSTADYAISVTGIAGPSGGNAQKPVGTVFIAFQNLEQSGCYEKHFLGTRHEIRQQTIKFALEMLLQKVSS